METTVKIIKDTVAHRIPIGKIVKLRGNPEIRKKKKCYNVVDFCCYISEDDFEILSESTNTTINPNSLTQEKDKEKAMTDWFDDYAKNHSVTKYKKGEKIKVVGVNKLTPNGTTSRAKDGTYFINEIDKKGRYWLRSMDSGDLNEYFCVEENIMGIVNNKISPPPAPPKNRIYHMKEEKNDDNFDIGDFFKMEN